MSETSKDFQLTTNSTNQPINQMKVSVIICTYTMERLKDLYEAIQSVMNQTRKPDEIIIAVDHNEKLMKSLKKELPKEVKIIHNIGTSGVSKTRSLGIRAASGMLIACMDDDAIAEKNWIEILIRTFSQNPSIAVIGGKCILIWPKKKRPFWFSEELDWIVGGTYRGMPVSSNGEIRNVSSCNMLAPKQIFEKVGFFNSRVGAVKGFFRGGEEAEFCLKVKQKFPNKMILYEPKAIVYHKVHPRRQTLRYIIRRSFEEGFSKAKLGKLVGANNSLSSENFYLRYLLFKSIPERLSRFYKKDNLLQTGAIIISIAATGLGYLIGRLKSYFTKL